MMFNFLLNYRFQSIDRGLNPKCPFAGEDLIKKPCVLIFVSVFWLKGKFPKVLIMVIFVNIQSLFSQLLKIWFFPWKSLSEIFPLKRNWLKSNRFWYLHQIFFAWKLHLVLLILTHLVFKLVSLLHCFLDYFRQNLNRKLHTWESGFELISHAVPSSVWTSDSPKTPNFANQFFWARESNFSIRNHSAKFIHQCLNRNFSTSEVALKKVSFFRSLRWNPFNLKLINVSQILTFHDTQTHFVL